jgi:hypothetical protein
MSETEISLINIVTKEEKKEEIKEIKEEKEINNTKKEESKKENKKNKKKINILIIDSDKNDWDVIFEKENNLNVDFIIDQAGKII